MMRMGVLWSFILKRRKARLASLPLLPPRSAVVVVVVVVVDMGP